VLTLWRPPLWGNPVPTSGEIRDARRRWNQRFAPLLASIEYGDSIAGRNIKDRDIRYGNIGYRDITYRDASSAANLSRLGTGHAGIEQRVAHLLATPRVRRVLKPVLAAGRAGMDTLEHISDDTHDTIEERLARLSALAQRVPLSSTRGPALPR
jgi:hypothetical protein